MARNHRSPVPLSALLAVVLAVVAHPGPAGAVTAETYEGFIKKDEMLKSVYLWGVTSTAQIAALRSRLFCLPEGKYIDPKFTEAVIEAGLLGLRKVGKYSPDLSVELVFIEAMRRKYACGPEE